MDNLTTIALAVIAALGGGTFASLMTQYAVRKATERKAIAEAEIKEAEATNLKAEAEATATQKSAEVWRNTVTHLQERVESLEGEVEDLRELRTESSKANEDLVKLLAAKDAEIKLLNEEIARLNKTILGLADRVVTLEKKLLD